MRRLLVLAIAVVMAVAMAAPASAHPITPPGKDDPVTFAGGTSQGHVKGLACAENVSPAIGFLTIPCTLGPGSD